MQLLLDEHLSPTLAERCANSRGIYAVAVSHVGLSGATDPVIWRYAFEHDYVLVTSNSRDFLDLLEVDLHPGLIIFSQGGLTRLEQWDWLVTALDYIAKQPSAESFMINRVIDVKMPGELIDREIPSPGR